MTLGAELAAAPPTTVGRVLHSELVTAYLHAWNGRPVPAARIAGWRRQVAAHQPRPGGRRCRECLAPDPCPWQAVASAALTAAETQKEGRPTGLAPSGDGTSPGGAPTLSARLHSTDPEATQV